MSQIRLENIVKRYEDGFLAVRNANLTINDGEFMVLVGPSGCGKSTTLRMIAGLEEVSDGSIFVGDQCVNDLEPGDRDIAMVFQNYALYPHMTVRSNMGFGLKMRGIEKAEIDKRVNMAAEILSLGTLLDRKPREMSGGQRQRVAVGRAIVRQPSAFLFDEPLSNLDAKLRVQMRTELAKLHQQLATTTVYVTHDQVEAMTLGHRITVMNGGVIQQVDTPLNLYRHPVNRFVAGFIGSPAMNFIRGNIQQSEFSVGAIRLHVGQVPHQGDALLGIRPDDLKPAEGEKDQLFSANIEVVERMGHETVLYFQLGKDPMVARIEDDLAIQAGERLSFAVKPNRWHLFEAEGDQLRIE
ncbi:MAG: sn-glycerol-3-phosphate ABC transporter ATP-binding protein UgpC [Planctomycetota bacterium]|nr:sn-glycerol-3-phosphate ABC transporter ATP-binding protein UgpC [Planctomycetota bacterium]